MIWQEKKPHEGVLRLENLPRAERLSLLEYVLEHHTDDLASGRLSLHQVEKFAFAGHNDLESFVSNRFLFFKAKGAIFAA